MNEQLIEAIKEQKERPCIVFICGDIMPNIHKALAQTSLAEDVKQLIILTKDQCEHNSDRTQLSAMDELVVKLKRFDLPIVNEDYLILKEEKVKWKGKKGFNSARNRIICKEAYC